MTRMRYVTYSADRPPTGGRPTAPPCSASVTAHLGPPGEDFLYSFKAAPSGRRATFMSDAAASARAGRAASGRSPRGARLLGCRSRTRNATDAVVRSYI